MLLRQMSACICCHIHMVKSSTLATLGEQDHPHIVLLPVCDDSIAAFHDGRAFSLPIALPASQKAAESEVSRLVTTMGAPEDLVISHVSSRGSVELWRADMPAVGGQPTLALEGLRWQPTAGVQMRESWRRAHFDALRLFGVLPLGDAGSMISSYSRWMRASKASTKAHGVIFFEMQRGSFAISVTGMRCRAFVYPRCLGIPYFTRRTVGLSLDTRASRVQRPISPSSFGGQICSAMCLILSVAAVRVRQLKVSLACGWALMLSPVCQYKRLRIGAWTSLGRCPSHVKL
jgi:hypothetical protein